MQQIHSCKNKSEPAQTCKLNHKETVRFHVAIIYSLHTICLYIFMYINDICIEFIDLGTDS